MTKPQIVYIGLGSNVGNRQRNVDKACRYLADSARIKLLKVSSKYLTPPMGPPQRDYINSAAKLQTDMSPDELLRELKSIEKTMGRKNSGKRWGPRVIDLDILFYGKRVINKPHLKIPHKGMPERGFVLEPLSEIAPRLMHPVKKVSVKKLLKHLNV